MSLKVFKNQDYDFTHENEQFDELVNILKERFDTTDDLNLLFANIYFGGVPLDALFVKRNAIIVIEFKNYTGNLKAAENGDWELDNGTKVKGGAGKNPFMQTRANKFSVLNELNTWFPRPYVNLGQISGVVVFNQPIKVTEDRISPKSKSWFHICDMNGIGAKLKNIASPGINYADSDLLDFPRIVNCKDVIYESPAIENRVQNIEQHIAVQPQVQNVNTALSDAVRSILKEYKYDIVAEREKPAKEAKYYTGEIELGEKAKEYIKTYYTAGLYNHQYEAAKSALKGNNVCIATSTSSGKTAIFHLATLEILEKDPEAKIIAVYPMKALGNQQVNSWNEKLQNVRCGRIDGNVKDLNQRLEILRDCSIVTFTPDTIHTFLLGKLKDTRCTTIIKNFISKLKLVIIDEVHLYRGMLGSNCAYMFRRLNACSIIAGGKIPQYLTASATIKDPIQHSSDISGVDSFEIVDSSMDTSPSCPTKVFFIRQGNGLASLLTKIATELPEQRTITFIDSRKKVTEVAFDVEAELKLQDHQIYPFKSGFEKNDYDEITKALEERRFKGIVSTSSLEVGINIPDLNIVILDGIPNSSTSFYQRLGRVGRGNTNNEAIVIIMDKSDSLITQRLFANPKELYNLPPEEPALYTDNKNLMFIQALHFVGTGKEFQSVSENNEDFERIKSQFTCFSKSFTDLCLQLMDGQITQDFQEQYDLGGDYPEAKYTVRQFGIQYKAHIDGEDSDREKGDLSMTNIMREAYPGAIYTYWGDPRRVLRVNVRTGHEVILARQITQNIKTKVKPIRWITPQRDSSIKNSAKYGDLLVNNLDVREFTQILGYKEVYKNGGDRNFLYENPDCPYYSQKVFENSIRTTGVIITHPSLNIIKKNQRELISMILYECFLSCNAFERSDIEYGTGILNTTIGNVPTGTPYIAIYDKVEGGLNITSCLLEKEILNRGFSVMNELVADSRESIVIGETRQLYPETKNVISQMYDDICINDGMRSDNKIISKDGIANGSMAYHLNPETDEKTEVTILNVAYSDINHEYQYILRDNQGEEYVELKGSLVHPIPGVSKKAGLWKEGTNIVISKEELW